MRTGNTRKSDVNPPEPTYCTTESPLWEQRQPVQIRNLAVERLSRRLNSLEISWSVEKLLCYEEKSRNLLLRAEALLREVRETLEKCFTAQKWNAVRGTKSTMENRNLVIEEANFSIRKIGPPRRELGHPAVQDWNLVFKIKFMKNNCTRNRVEKRNLVLKSGDPAKPSRDNLEKKPMKETPWKKR
jgi:hypothetical protein